MKKTWNRIIVKVGSNVLSRKDGTLDVTRMSAIVDQIAELRKAGLEVIMVSSGAVASGRSEVHPLKKLDSVEQRQLFSAVGQAKLMGRYYQLFGDHGICVGQVLTTKEDFATRRLYLNQKSCMSVMLANGVIPIVNENDTISVTELMFTDNDELSGLIATMMDAQALVILSNIDGIYNGNPTDPQAKVIREIAPADDLTAYIQTSRSNFGRGGMLTKTRIASKVADEGIEVVIANGKQENILLNLYLHPEDTVCTRFIPSEASISGVKKWIAHSEDFAKGEVHINHDAALRLTSETAASLLMVGITDIKGEFEKDDIVRIIDDQQEVIGVGRANYAAKDARQQMGKHGGKPMVHYDYLFIEH